MERKFDLDERLINFSAAIIDVSEGLPKYFAGNHIAGQLVRSGTSPALNYGEAQSAESRNDFIHKMKISAKELRETFNCLRIIKKKNWYPQEKMLPVLDENNQLISIFVKSIETAKRIMKLNNSRFKIPCSLFNICPFLVTSCSNKINYG
jgi:four helix bundle protein